MIMMTIMSLFPVPTITDTCCHFRYKRHDYDCAQSRHEKVCPSDCRCRSIHIIHLVSKKLCKLIFCQNFVKFRPTRPTTIRKRFTFILILTSPCFQTLLQVYYAKIKERKRPSTFINYYIYNMPINTKIYMYIATMAATINGHPCNFKTIYAHDCNLLNLTFSPFDFQRIVLYYMQ